MAAAHYVQCPGYMGSWLRPTRSRHNVQTQASLKRRLNGSPGAIPLSRHGMQAEPGIPMTSTSCVAPRDCGRNCHTTLYASNVPSLQDHDQGQHRVDPMSQRRCHQSSIGTEVLKQYHCPGTECGQGPAHPWCWKVMLIHGVVAMAAIQCRMCCPSTKHGQSRTHT